MGADGGSIPRRDELVKEKPKEEKPDLKEITRIKWFLCAISKETLKAPVVACKYGNLFNKEAVIRGLLEKTIPSTYGYIRSLKDIFNVNFKVNPAYDALGEKQNTTIVDIAQDAPFVCPITGLEVGGNYKFHCIKSCGCAISDRALRECPSELCLNCGKPFNKDDVIPLNPSEEELKELKKKYKAEGKDKKKSKSKEKQTGETINAGKEEVNLDEENGKDKDSIEKKDKKRKQKNSKMPAAKKQASGPSIDPSILKLVPSVTVKPEYAASQAYTSIFTSSLKEVKETFTCSTTFARRPQEETS